MDNNNNNNSNDNDNNVANNNVTSNNEDRIQLKKWNAVTLWSWDIEVDTCAICHNLVMEECIECQARRNTDTSECTVAWGLCNHAFHFHCISLWLKQRVVCPMCNSDWEWNRYGAL